MQLQSADKDIRNHFKLNKNFIPSFSVKGWWAHLTVMGM